MDRYNSKKCRALEDAIDDFGIPSHVEVENGSIKIILLGTTPVTIEKVSSGSQVVIPTTNWKTIV